VSKSSKPRSSDRNAELTSTIHINSLRNVPDASSVERAKAALLALNEENRAMLSQLSSDKAIFVVLSGASQGARYLLDADQISIGRDKQSEIFFDDATVSRKHASIRRIGGTFQIVDEGSLNGTYVNAMSVPMADLSTGDVVNIGKYKLTFFSAQNNSGGK